MPDWLTHVVIGLILIDIFKVRKKSLVLLGVLLPDFLPKLILLRLFFPVQDYLNYKVLTAFHVPFVFFFFTLLIAPLFKYNYKKVVFWLNLGAISHFLADSLLRHFSDAGIKLFYPLLLNKFTLGLVWPNESYFILIPALIVYLGIILIKKKFTVNFKKILYNKPLVRKI